MPIKIDAKKVIEAKTEVKPKVKAKAKKAVNTKAKTKKSTIVRKGKIKIEVPIIETKEQTIKPTVASNPEIESKDPASSPVVAAVKDGTKLRNGVAKTCMKYIVELMLVQKFTDEEIIEMAKNRFPDYGPTINSKEMGRARWLANTGKINGFPMVDKELMLRLFRNSEGKLVHKSDLPAKKGRIKYTKENDPLLKFGFKNVK